MQGTGRQSEVGTKAAVKKGPGAGPSRDTGGAWALEVGVRG